MKRSVPGPAVLIGTRPVESHTTLGRLGIPFVWVVDPDEELPATSANVLQVIRAPYRSDPLCVLQLPLPADTCAVFSFTELGSLPAALLSEALGLPTVPVSAVLRARNKLLMRRLLSDASIGPAFGVVGEQEPRDEDFPVIAKPAEGSGSKGIAFVPDPACYRERAQELAGLMWEHYMTGPEYSVEAVSFPGGHRILGVTAKHTTGPPSFVETGHEAPAVLSPELRKEIEECVHLCLDTLGLNLGASHTEVKLEDGRAMIIETHTRPGGDRIPLLTRLVSGHDQYELAVQSVLPWAVSEPAESLYACAAVHYFPWREVTVEEVTGLDSCRGAAGVVETVISVRNGERIPLWNYSHVRPGHVVIGADNREELRRRIAAAGRSVRPRFS